MNDNNNENHIIITTQEELNAVSKDFKGVIEVNSSKDILIKINCDEFKELYGLGSGIIVKHGRLELNGSKYYAEVYNDSYVIAKGKGYISTFDESIVLTYDECRGMAWKNSKIYVYSENCKFSVEGNAKIIDCIEKDKPIEEHKEKEDANETIKKSIPQWILDRKERIFNDLAKNIPDKMKEIPNWAAVSVLYDADLKKNKKVIFDCNVVDVKKWAKSNDPTTWTTFDNALEYGKSHNCDALAFALTKESGLFCIDLDNALSVDPKDTKRHIYSDLVWNIYNKADSTYAEKSVSGKGLHFFGKKKNNAENHALFNGSMDNKSKDGKFEIYDSFRFITVTGNLFLKSKPSLMLFDEGAELFKVCESQVENKTYLSPDPKTENTYKSNLSLDDVYKMIEKSKIADTFNSLNNGVDLCGDHSRSDLKLCCILAFFSNKDRYIIEEGFRNSSLYRPNKGDKYVERTVEKAMNVSKEKSK